MAFPASAALFYSARWERVEATRRTPDPFPGVDGERAVSDTKRYLDSNRRLWNEWSHLHETSDSARQFYRLDEFKAGMSKLHDYEVQEVGIVAGRDLLHLQCHFGMDTLSWARLGARVTGVDFSEEAIRQARELSAELGIEASFVLSDVYSLPEKLAADFEVVYASRGVIGWLPDLARWAEVVAHFLRPGGIFYLTEAHPFFYVFDDEREDQELRVRYPYFPQPEPLASPVKGSYADPQADVKHEVEYGWPHSIGEVVTAVARAGLHIEFLHEFPFLDWPVPFAEKREGVWQLRQQQKGEIPLSFSLRATKPA